MIETILSISFVCFLLLYFSFNLDKKHFLLKLFITFWVFFTLILIPQNVLTTQICSNELINQTVSGNLTTNIYDIVCINQDNAEAFDFYKNYLFYIKIFVIYILLYFIYEVLNFTGKTAGIKQSWSNIKSRYNNKK